jgi:hypothetical protein
VHELFTVCDLTDEVLGLQEEVQTRLAAQRSMLDGDLRGRRCWLRCQDKIMSVKPLSAAGGSQDRGRFFDAVFIARSAGPTGHG